MDKYNIIYFFPCLFNNIKLETKWAWQRVFRGFDDRYYWGLCGELARVIPKVVRHMKDWGTGCPQEFYKEKSKDECKQWGEVLEKIAKGFEAIEEMDDKCLYRGKRYEKLYKVQKEGLELFIENYRNLWD